MTATFNTSYFSAPALSNAQAGKKDYRSNALNNYTVEVVDFDGDTFSYEVEAENASQASENATAMAQAQGVQVDYCNVYSYE